MQIINTLFSILLGSIVFLSGLTCITMGITSFPINNSVAALLIMLGVSGCYIGLGFGSQSARVL